MKPFPTEQYSELFSYNLFEKLEGNWEGTSFVLWAKDKDGKYFHANENYLKYFGFTKESDLIGLNDFDLCHTYDQSIQIRKNDAQVFQSKRTHVFEEIARVATGETLTAISYKKPFLLKNEKIIGTLGIAIVLPSHMQHTPAVRKYFSHLSKQQNECLNLLAQGFSIKGIAMEMKLSPRTIEHYLEHIKLKLNCNTRRELIAYFFNRR